ncbi:MAG: glycosyl hydrolase-related protein, partial [Actinomycetota bacterium]
VSHQRCIVLDAVEQRITISECDGPLDALMTHPPRIVRGVPGVGAPDAVLEVPGALISCVKPADDGSGDLIVRIWETRGASTRGVLRTQRKSAIDCNALEEPVAESITRTDEGIAITLGPFQIRTLRLPRS